MSKTVGYRIIYNIVYRKPNISKIQLKTGSKEKRSACIFKCSNMSDSLQARGLGPARLLCPWDYPSNNTGVGCHFLLQGIFLTHGLNPCPLQLQRWRVDSLPLSHLEASHILRPCHIKAFTSMGPLQPCVTCTEVLVLSIVQMGQPRHGEVK